MTFAFRVSADIVLGDIVPFGELLQFPPHDRMRNAGLPVLVHQLRVLQVVEVDVSIDEFQIVHERISHVERYHDAVQLREPPRLE